MERRSFLRNTLAASAGFILLPGWAGSEVGDQPEPAALATTGFAEPPLSAAPWCHWLWIDGQVTRQGITLDLEAMQRMGIGGAICGSREAGIPQGLAAYGSDGWLQLIGFAATEARRLGMQLVLQDTPEEATNPLVQPEMARQQLVWTESLVSGGAINQVLPPPRHWGYYEDIAVLAYPALACEKGPMRDKLLKVVVSGKETDAARWMNDGIAAGTDPGVPATKETLLLQFREPFETRALSVKADPVPDAASLLRDGVLLLEASANGTDFRQIGSFPIPEQPGLSSFSYAPAEAVYYRLTIPAGVPVSQVELHSGPRLAGWPDAGGTASAARTVPLITTAETIDPTTVRDISDQVDREGRLQWKAPAGNWVVLRLGHTTVPPRSGKKGLVPDPFRKEALDTYFEQFLDTVLRQAGQHKQDETTGGFKGFAVGSDRSGSPLYWTRDFLRLFRQRRQYDLLQWMPVLTGRILGSVAATAQCLWDVRKVQETLAAENFYTYFSRKCRSKGLALYPAPVFDRMADPAFNELPAGYRNLYSVQPEAPVQAVTGTAVQATTGAGRWTSYPFSLKAAGDHAFTKGISRLVLTGFVHQPFATGKPGITTAAGGFLDRNHTWAEKASGWINYLRRVQYLAQQGSYIADCCYFEGDQPSPVWPPTGLPAGYKYNRVDADTLQNRISIDNGAVVLAGGMRYSVCVMAPSSSIEKETAAQLVKLVRAGMTLVVMSRPDTAAGRKDTDREVQQQVAVLYGPLNESSQAAYQLGKGRVLWARSVPEALKRLTISPDFTYTAQNTDADIRYLHQQTADSHIYFVSNQKRSEEIITASFRLQGFQPEIWDAETGEQSDALFFEVSAGRTLLPLTLTPAGSLLVVFRKKGPAIYTRLLQGGKAVLHAGLSYKRFDPTDYYFYKNTFRIMFWIRPDTLAASGQGMLVPAPEGASVFGAGTAAVGIGAGQNGVWIYERTKGPARQVLFAEQPIEGWTHIALAYQEGKPVVYINGRQVAEGRKSSAIVRPILNAPVEEEGAIAYFEGNYTKPQLIDNILPGNEVVYRYRSGLPAPLLPQRAEVRRRNGKTTLLAWKDAVYKLEAKNGSREYPVTGCRQIVLPGSWQVVFPPASGVPAIRLAQLSSWHLHPDNRIRYFSGTATYLKSVPVSATYLVPGNRLFLHLGRVEVLAEVKINGSKAGLVWKEPYLLEITPWIKAGNNQLEIAVTNLWPNRLIGDEYLPAENSYGAANNINQLPDWYVKNQPKPGKRKTFTTHRVYHQQDPLLPSGLLGPVTMLVAVEKPLTEEGA